VSTGMGEAVRSFRREYAAQRAAEGRGAGGRAELLALPYLTAGPTAGQWRVRARSFAALERWILKPLAPVAGAGAPPALLDLGAGNAWLSWRAARLGWRAVALDLRDDDVDGLGAAAPYLEDAPGRVHRLVASFQSLPVKPGRFDLVVFNASLHYALDLAATLAEAARATRRGGRIAVLDSPWYGDERAGEAMVREKRLRASQRFGERAAALLALPFIEFLTPARIRDASIALGLDWRRHVVRYPLEYELRPLLAHLQRRRPPSRFDLWEAIVP